MPSRTMSPEQNSWQWPGNSRSVFDAYLGEFVHPCCASCTLTLTLPWSWNTKQRLSHFFKSDVLFGHDMISGITDFPLHKLLNKYLLQEIGLPDVDTARNIVLCKTMRIVVFIFQQPSLIGYSWSMDALWEAGLLLNQVQAKVVSLCQVKAPVLPPTENFRARLHPCRMA